MPVNRSWLSSALLWHVVMMPKIGKRWGRGCRPRQILGYQPMINDVWVKKKTGNVSRYETIVAVEKQ